jgi:hypothetical protein
MHCASPLQEVWHAVAPQTYGEQAWVTASGQLPEPLQVAATVSVPPVHDADRHEVDAPGYVQVAVVVPLQLPPQAEPSVVQAGRPSGAPVTAVQVPT